jgi:hypothetical protein
MKQTTQSNRGAEARTPTGIDWSSTLEHIELEQWGIMTLEERQNYAALRAKHEGVLRRTKARAMRHQRLAQRLRITPLELLARQSAQLEQQWLEARLADMRNRKRDAKSDPHNVLGWPYEMLERIRSRNQSVRRAQAEYVEIEEIADSIVRSKQMAEWKAKYGFSKPATPTPADVEPNADKSIAPAVADDDDRIETKHDSEASEPALTRSQVNVLNTMADFDGSRLLSAKMIADEMAPVVRLSEETVRQCVKRLIDCGLAERPQGDRSGARLTLAGRRRAVKIAD